MIVRSLYLMRRTVDSGTDVLHWGFVALLALLVCMVLWTPLQNPETSRLVKFEHVIFPLLDFWISALAFQIAYKKGTKSVAARGARARWLNLRR